MGQVIRYDEKSCVVSGVVQDIDRSVIAIYRHAGRAPLRYQFWP